MTWRRLILATTAVCLLGVPGRPVAAQSTAPNDPFADYRHFSRILEVGPWQAPSEESLPDGAILRLLPAEVRSHWNSARPWGVNDGAVWQGRGATLVASAGVRAQWRWLSAQLKPVAFRAENRAFTLSPLTGNVGLGPYAYPSGFSQTIDMPQRFGDEALSRVDLGDSYLRADIGPVAFGLSNENLWWGPGRRNAIIMTNNAPGFGHAFVGTSRPANVRIGTLTARWQWGRLRESDYFDADETNDSRYFTGLTATFVPKGAPGLELGVTRTFIAAWRDGGPDLDDVLLAFIPLQKKRLATPDNPTGDDATDQMASIFVRYEMPSAGFEVYGEWGRGDHSWDLRDFLTQPEHASAFLLGFQKVIARGSERAWRIAGEITILGTPRTGQVRPPASAFYEHHIITQGYTQRGQVMGAGIGPGSSQASVMLDRFARWGKLGFGVQRTVYDNNRFYSEDRLWDTNEAEPALLAEVLVFRGSWDLEAGLTAAQLLNKHYERRNDELNVNLRMGARYHFARRPF